jgi:hypothetical protein
MHMILPPEDDRPWPTLGPQVCAWMTSSLAFGPGDLRGLPYELDDEDRALLYRLYEVFPPLHPKAGKRRFNTGVVMLRKGTKKSERAGAIAAVELAPDGPVRCDGFRQVDGVWEPVGRPVVDPYIPMVAYSEKQAEDTAFAAMYVMIAEGPAADRFDVGLDRIMRVRGDGKAEALSTAPDSRDGGRTTFQVKEETHRWTLPRQLEAHRTMKANLAKRPIADPWELHVTTAYEPGAGSLAEKMHAGARYQLEQGEETARRSRMFFFYRWADESIDITTPEGLLDAIDDASGPAAAVWSDYDRIADQWTEAGADPRYLERTWLNRVKKGAGQAFDVPLWETRVPEVDEGEPPYAVAKAERDDDGRIVKAGALIALSWHGARYWDAADLVGTEITTGFQWLVAHWQRPPDVDEWEVPEDEVDLAVDAAFSEYSVWRFYVHPTAWESSSARWAATYGADRVLAWKTNAWTQLTRAVRAFVEAIASGEENHADDERLTAHVGAAHKRYLTSIRDDDGKPVWVPVKERADSPFPINAVMAAIIGWQCRLDAVKAGALEPVEWKVA